MYPLKDVYMFDPKSIKGLTEIGKKSIVGVETPIWTEYITDFERLCYMCFPRWFAVADTAWNGRDEKNYREFRLAAKSYCDALRKWVFLPLPNVIGTRVRKSGFVKPWRLPIIL